MQPNKFSSAVVTHRQQERFRFREGCIKFVLYGCTSVSVLITVAILALLTTETVRFFALDEVRFGDFMLGTKWNPLLGADKHFGISPLICGTVLVACIAMAVAAPLGLITAIFMSEFAAAGLRDRLRPALDILAGIPTVVYGFFALTFITPTLIRVDSGFDSYNAMSAGIAVGFLCLPILASLIEDALRAVPPDLRESAYALGATRYEVAVKVVVPAASAGIISAVLLALARAVGETMIVALAAGSRPQFAVDPRNEIQTMTAYVAQVAKGEINHFGVEYYSIYAIAAALFLITLSLTVTGFVIRRRFFKAYA